MKTIPVGITYALWSGAGIILVSLVGFFSLLAFLLHSSLSSPLAVLSGFVGCALMFVSISLYLTATKLTTYRSLHDLSR
jgi:small multidrug resistance pump